MADDTRPHDDATRRALMVLAPDVDALELEDPATLRSARGAGRRRALVVVAVAAALLLVATVAVLGLLGGVGRASDPAAPTGPPSSSAPSTEVPTTPAATSTDVLGEDGSLGPFRVGMDRASVQTAIATAGLEGSVRITSRDLGGGIVNRVLVQEGADSGVGDGDVIGAFDRETDRLAALVAPATARIRGLGVGSPVGAFEQEFPGQVATNDTSTVYLLTLEGGIRLQLGRPSSFLDRSAVGAIVVLPPGADPFPYFS